MTPSAQQPGFSLVEIIIAMLVLTMGLLAMAASTGYVATQIRAANLRGERAFAVEQVAERLRASPFETLASREQGAAETVGSFSVWWSIDSPSHHLRQITLVSQGPGYRQGIGWTPNASDTISFSILRPFR